MFIIRRAKLDDVSTLMKLAKMVHFINLPADRQIIAEKVARSRKGFLDAAQHASAPGKKIVKKFKPNSEHAQSGHAADFVLQGLGESNQNSNLFFFVLEDTDNPGCLGTSQLVSEMGGPGNPNVCFKLERREMYSPGLKTGSTHDVARLYFDETAPTELGGLILQPSFRGHPAKLGRFVALIRFHLVGLYPKLFSDTMLAEMMAPIGHDGSCLFWDHVGRRFIPLSYDEADRLCQYSREFMISLMPKGDIYLSLLPPKPRTEVGTVGIETRPARRMLEKLGFGYHGYIDPFDGGPYLHAKTADIQMVRDSRWAELGPAAPASKCKQSGYISVLPKDGEFVAINELHHIDTKGRVCLPAAVMETVGWVPGMTVGYTPMSSPTAVPAASSRTPKPATEPKPKASKAASPSKAKPKAKPKPSKRAQA